MLNINNSIVKKPWGHEYLCFQNKSLSIWLLAINKESETSLHCHPNKDTGYVVLDGKLELSFIRGTKKLKKLDKVYIFKKRFHKSKNVHSKTSYILEIETPINKDDLVRMNDKYGREGKPYENSKNFLKKNKDCLDIKNVTNKQFTTHFLKRTFKHFNLFTNKSKISSYRKNDLFIFTSGGFFEKKDMLIQPADVMDGNSLKLFNKNFSLKRNTKVIHVS